MSSPKPVMVVVMVGSSSVVTMHSLWLVTGIMNKICKRKKKTNTRNLPVTNHKLCMVTTLLEPTITTTITGLEATDVIRPGGKNSQASIFLFILIVGSIVILFFSYTPFNQSFARSPSNRHIQTAAVAPGHSMGASSSYLLKSGYSNTTIRMHINCRGGLYPRTKDVKRFDVPDNKVDWGSPFKKYTPQDYTAESVLQKPFWADPDFRNSSESFNIKWNEIDNNVDRRSFGEKYEIPNNIPRNPKGRTGIKGRGLLGRWGPNHAADPIITRWKIKDGKKATDKNGKNILQFIAIQRRDTGDWAIPGGMVDPGELVSATLQREFSEEALNTLNLTPEKKDELNKSLKSFFEEGKEVYKGYVDDIRNTDNAWIETVAMNFHDDLGTSVANLPLTAGDDAVNVKWMDITNKVKLYANHRNFIEKVAKDLGASW